MSLTLVIDPGIVQDWPAVAATLGISNMAPVNGPTTTLGHNVPPAGYFVVQQCGSTLTFFDGPLTPAQVAAIPACPVDVNADALKSRASTALTNNAAFLALASPTTAQNAAQIKSLTRQVDGLIRLTLGIFDSTSDS